MDTTLVGENTDLLILLCYHASLDSRNIFFRPESKKITKKPRVWSIKAVKEQLGPEIAATFSFCMQSLDVILPHTYMALERTLLSRSLN